MISPLNGQQTDQEEANTPLDKLKDRIGELNSQVDIYTTIEQTEHITLVSGLSQVLEDTYSIYLKTHNCRWKVTEPLSDSLDELLEKQYTEMTTAVEQITERIKALGIPTPDPHTEFLRLSSMAETAEVPTLQDMIPLLIESNESVSRKALFVSEQAQMAGYSLTAELLTERIKVHQQNASLLRKYLRI